MTNVRKAIYMAVAFCCLNLTVSAQNITLKMSDITVKQAMEELKNKSGYTFVFSSSDLDTQRKVTVSVSNESLDKAVKQILEGQHLTYEIKGKNIIIKKIDPAALKKRKITGVITDEKGEPIVGANVLEKGTANGTITNVDGSYSIEMPGSAVLQISYIGYNTIEITVGNKFVFNVQMKEDAKALGEVVVTALGIKREEKALGYAVQKVSGDNLSTVKPVDVATSLTGKIAGLNVQNSTEFNSAPSLSLRGETPLLVIDGVPYGNVSLSDIAADDIESIDVLKGATASALYGARGGSGAVMVTTKKGQKEGLNITVNSSTMFNAGYLKKPEVQTAYSSGSAGHYAVGDYVWGDKLDIGRTALQYDPSTYEWKEMPLVSKGKNNLKNFQELSLVTNNNISVSQKGKYGSVRTSLTHVYNKGQYPNEKMNKFIYSVGGDMKWKDFSFEGGLTYNKQFYPNDMGSGYGGSGFLYNLLVWSGSEYDIRDYRNYWVTPGEKQNWMDENWYDNPYFIANEITRSSDYDLVNGYLSAAYDFTPWLKLSVRSGLDSYSQKKQWKNPVSAVGGWHIKGYYGLQRLGGYSLNNDAILSANHTFGDFTVDGFVGGTIYLWKSDNILGETQNGLTIPEYYSLKASVDPVKTTSAYTKKQVNSVYGKISASWKSTLFVDVTARNDWSSSLPAETRSYFYPSVAGSVVLSQFIPMPQVIDFWKVRGSWTQTKQDLNVYETNNTYSITTDMWNGLSASYYPTSIRGVAVKPSATRSYEIGTALNMFKNRLRVDVAYYNKLYYNLTRKAGISEASGFGSTLINIQEEQVRKGVEITVSGDVIRTKDWSWNALFNWARDRYYYSKVDPVYSTQKPWVAAGKRWDWVGVEDWERDPQGNIVHENGYPVLSKYQSVKGYEYPDWIWGLSNTIKYRNFTLNFTIDGRVGGTMHSVTDQAMWNSGAHIDSDNQWRYAEVVEGKTNYIGKGVKIVSGKVEYDSNGQIINDTRVFAPNDVPASYETYMKNMNPYIGSVRSQNLFDQTFVKLRDLSLSYDMPKTVCQKLRLKGLAVAFVGQNLLIWTKEFRFSDPDRAADNLNSPSVRYLGFNVKLDL